MTRLPILLVVAVLLAGGCVDGGELVRDALREIDRALSGTYADLYGEYTDDDEVTEDDIDCSQPLFTRTEPLPSGTHPAAVITREGEYWDCTEGVEVYNSNGTFAGKITDSEVAQWALDFWNVCRVGTRPPDYAGNWIVAFYDSTDYICGRFDALPGIVFCRSAVLSSDGFSVRLGSGGAIQNGIIEETFPEDEVCHLRRE